MTPSQTRQPREAAKEKEAREELRALRLEREGGGERGEGSRDVGEDPEAAAAFEKKERIVRTPTNRAEERGGF